MRVGVRIFHWVGPSLIWATTPTAFCAEAPAPAADPAPAPSAQRAGNPYEAHDKAFGVTVRVLIASPDASGAQMAAGEAIRDIKRIESLFGASKKDSEIARLNQAAGTEVTIVTRDTLEALRRGQTWSSTTHGAFSLTYAPVAALWHFVPAPGAAPAVPDKGLLTSRLALVGDQEILLDASAHTAKLARVGMAVSLANLAKGYAADCGLAALKTRGFDQVLVAVGGTVLAHGKKGSDAWRVGILDPRGKGTFALVALKDEAAATVGDYERYFELDGVRYSDRIDPRTGYPAQGLRSVTVLAGEAADAEALASGVFILGAKAGMALIEAQTGTQAILVDSQNEVSISTGLKDRIKIVRAPTP